LKLINVNYRIMEMTDDSISSIVLFLASCGFEVRSSSVSPDQHDDLFHFINKKYCLKCYTSSWKLSHRSCLFLYTLMSVLWNTVINHQEMSFI